VLLWDFATLEVVADYQAGGSGHSPLCLVSRPDRRALAAGTSNGNLSCSISIRNRGRRSLQRSQDAG
jgi:hypothetical protein